MKKNSRYSDSRDEALISLLNEGDHEAFTEIYNRYSMILYRQVHRILRDNDLCHDILQEVFLSIWNKRGEFQVHGLLAAYLFKSVRNRVLNHISRQQVMDKYIREIQDFSVCWTGAADEHVLKKELQHIIEAEKARLPPRTRQLYELNREQYMSYKEIGQQLHISEKTVKKQVFNALRIIRLRIASLARMLLILFP